MPCLIEAHGSSYRIKDPGGLIGKSLRAGNPYEARLLEHVFRRGFRGLAVDAGANVGNHTLWLAAVCGLRVEAFEPLCFAELARNVILNDLGDLVRVHPYALGAQEGRAAPVGKGRLESGPGEVRVSRLDDFSLRDVCLVKIDVEGMEPEVLRGAEQTLRRERPVIYAEAWDASAHEELRKLLEPLGYEHTRTFGATPLEEWEP